MGLRQLCARTPALAGGASETYQVIRSLRRPLCRIYLQNAADDGNLSPLNIPFGKKIKWALLELP